jgi:hypothetical protein
MQDLRPTLTANRNRSHPAGNLNRERWEGRRGRRRLPGILCVLTRSAVLLFPVGREFEPQEMGRTQRKTAADTSASRLDDYP